MSPGGNIGTTVKATRPSRKVKQEKQRRANVKRYAARVSAGLSIFSDGNPPPNPNNPFGIS